MTIAFPGYPPSGKGVERGNLGFLFPPTGGLKKMVFWYSSN